MSSSCLVDEHGNLVAYVEAGNHGRMLGALPPGYAVVVEPPPSADAWWDDKHGWNLRPQQPSPVHVWDAMSHAWVLMPLEDAKARARAVLRARRAAAMDAVLVVDGLPFDASHDSRVEIRLRGLEARMSALDGKPWSCRWKLADGRTVDLSASQMAAVADAVVSRIDEARSAEAEARGAVERADGPGDISSIPGIENL